MRRVLITGLHGFTGRYLATALETSNWEVWGLGNDSAQDTSRYRQVDLADRSSLQAAVCEAAPDAVAHLAGIAYVGHGDVNDIYQTNLIGTRNLLAALNELDKKPECILLASSANVYGNQEGKLDETSPTLPENDYAVSKLAMEHMARLWTEQLPIVIARPFNYTGAGQTTSFLLPKIVDHFRRRARVIELGNLNICRDFSDIRSVAQAYKGLLESCPAGETVNICSGRSYSLHDVLEITEQISGYKPEIRVNPDFVRTNEIKSLSGNPGKLRRLIGDWHSRPLDETLTWMLETSSCPG